MNLLKAIVPILIGLTIAVISVPGNDSTEGFPKKPVTLIVAYSPGGAVDNIARTVAKNIEPYLGQRVVVQNKPGAGGEIGYRSLAMSKSDGYTMGIITSPPILMLEMLRGTAGAGAGEFEPVAILQKDPVVLVVNSDSPYSTLHDLMSAASDGDTRLNVAGDGPNSNNQLQLVVAEQMLGVQFNFVPFNGSGPSITALLGKQVDAAVPSASSATTYINRGDLRVLAVFAEERYQYLPDSPTVFEASAIAVPDVGAAVRGLVLPRGVPDDRQRVISAALDALFADEAFSASSRSAQIPLYYKDAQEFGRYLDETGTLLPDYLPLMQNEEAGQ